MMTSSVWRRFALDVAIRIVRGIDASGQDGLQDVTVDDVMTLLAVAAVAKFAARAGLRAAFKNVKTISNEPVATIGAGSKNVAIVGPQGKLGEFDVVLSNVFVENKSAVGIAKGVEITGKPYNQIAEEWAF